MSVPSLVAVIDDDEDVRTSLEMLIDSIGHETVLFASADALLACGDVRKFDCFVSDVQMPGTDGIQLACRLRDLTKAPVILITAFPSQEIEYRARQASVGVFLRKPFDPNELIAALEAILS